MDLRNYIFEAINEVGIILDENEKADAHLNLSNYIQDSLQFMSFIFSLEEKLGREVPNEILNYKAIADMENFIRILSSNQ